MAGAGSDTDGEGDADGSERIVVANGQDIDKRYYHEVSKRMARDWDLRKLAYLGPPLWTVLSVLVLFWVARSLVPGGLSPVTQLSAAVGVLLSPGRGTVSQTIAENALWLLGGTILALFLLVPLLEILADAISGLRDTVRKLGGLAAGLVRVFDPEVWQTSNYWNPFTSHLSGRDPLVVLANHTDAPVSGVFSDGPYYGNVFVDSVYVTVDGDLGPTQRLLTVLYDYRLRWLRRGLLAALGGIVFLWAVDPLTDVTTTPFAGVLPWWELAVASVVLAVTVLVLLWLTRYPQFLVRFFAESAGLSRYKHLLNEPSSPTPTRNDGRIGLSNSLSGYGLFFVSEFFYALFGYVRYDVSVDESRLLPPEDRDHDESAGANADSPYPPSGFDEPNDAHATAAARELLWSAVPRDSVRAGGTDADVSVTITGVDYYTIDERPARLRDRLARWLSNRRGDEPGGSRSDDVEMEDAFERRRAGDGIGLRLPVKKFMSVPHGLSAETLTEPPGTDPDLYLFDESDANDLQWDEDAIHYLLLGGGEHQQGINKLVLSMKAAGYENVDVLENAFSSVVPREDGDSRGGIGERIRRRIRPGEPVDADGLADPAFFPTEYFVSGVFGKEEFFRQDDDAFLLLPHELPAERDRTVVVHAIVGMSAVGTKVGFLYWLDQYESGFPDLEADTAYCIRHPGPTEFDGVEDVGHLYLNSSWRDPETDPLEFTRTPVDADPDRAREGAPAADREDAAAATDTSGQPAAETDDDERANPRGDTAKNERPLNRRRLHFEYHRLDLSYDSTRS